MESLWMLLPISIVLVGIALALFNWAANNRQFDNLEQHALDVLNEED